MLGKDTQRGAGLCVARLYLVSLVGRRAKMCGPAHGPSHWLTRSNDVEASARCHFRCLSKHVEKTNWQVYAYYK